MVHRGKGHRLDKQANGKKYIEEQDIGRNAIDKKNKVE